MSKLSLKTVLSRYISTLYVWRNGKRCVSIIDVAIQVGLPILIGIASAVLGFSFQGISNLIAGVSVVSALLGAVTVFLFQTRVQLNDKMERKTLEGSTTQGSIFDDGDVDVLDELFFSVVWCIFEGMTISVVLIIFDCIGIAGAEELGMAWSCISSIVVMISCNLILVLMMCLKRMARIYERFGMHISKEKLSR
ncbi:MULTISPECIES: hypothetical protein [unclassified Adlercreutzia]|uniref:hypothetical protein n=1 Tax=unclassified Adlercreutzia TaxID=2636013 RepID=UPI0013ECB254|nr:MULTISPECIES: hypothetical protein [unclassified Adlercreutzia]